VKKRITRRTLIRQVAAGGAGLALGKSAAHGAVRVTTVAVVGGGLAGLVAARQLRRLGVGCVVLEARERVGGRTWSKTIPGKRWRIDGGAQWVGPTQTEVLALAEELGVATQPTFDEGRSLLLIGGARTEVEGEGGLGSGEEVGRVRARLEEMAAQVPLEAPWSAPKAATWDNQSLAEWLAANAPATEVRATFEAITPVIVGGSPAQVSLLWWLFYLHSAGGLTPLISTAGGAQDRHFIGGSQSLSEKLHARLGESVLLGRPVRLVRVRDGEVSVFAQGLQVQAQRAVIAMMPADANRITFEPALPRARRALQANWPSMSGVKWSVVYERPFWRQAGLDGQATSDLTAAFTFDSSPRDGSFGVLTVFPNEALLPDDPEAARQAVLGSLVTLFGERADRPLAVIDTDWGAEPYTAGCISPVPPGLLTSWGAALEKPIGPLHWAGTETAAVWNGYMDGAVRSGKRVAEEVAAALR
jgi:monoamine oxidase